jgi:GNAT superfamily N-acetyltransferase
MELRHPDGRDDARALVRVHGLAWRAAYRDLLPAAVVDRIPVEAPEQSVTEWTERVERNRERFLVADVDGDVRGYARVTWGSETKPFVDADEAGLKEIYVHPDHWGEGIGTVLLETGFGLVPDRIETVKLEMLSGNTVGEAFYESRGFERVDTGEYESAGESYPTAIYARSV